MNSLNIAIVFHSGFGHTAKLAQSIKVGAASVEHIRPMLMTVSEAQRQWEALEDCEAIIFGAPTYMGSVSAEFKAFEEATSSAVMGKGFVWSGKLAAGFTNSGAQSGVSVALRPVDRRLTSI